MSTLTVLLVALVGAALAWAWVYVAPWLPVVIVVLLAVLGLAVFQLGKGKIGTEPVKAIKWMEWRWLLPASLAAAGSGAAILIAAVLVGQEQWSTEAKGIVGAISGALGAAITGWFVKSAEDAGSLWVSNPIRDAFHAEFPEGDDRLPKESAAELAVFGDPHAGHKGWGRTARRARAQAVADQLNANAQEPVGSEKSERGGETPA